MLFDHSENVKHSTRAGFSPSLDTSPEAYARGFLVLLPGFCCLGGVCVCVCCFLGLGHCFIHCSVYAVPTVTELSLAFPWLTWDVSNDVPSGLFWQSLQSPGARKDMDSIDSWQRNSLEKALGTSSCNDSSKLLSEVSKKMLNYTLGL